MQVAIYINQCCVKCTHTFNLIVISYIQIIVINSSYSSSLAILFLKLSICLRRAFFLIPSLTDSSIGLYPQDKCQDTANSCYIHF